ncbi:MAG: Rieske (2Fe-2S) protein [Proteobacteria bacterium]|nr:Rieske (2Fe-2S) protein [Pseudomonadota bacterium]
MSAPPHTVLCRLDEIPAPGSKGFALGDGDGRRDIFVVRDTGGVYAYENSCPHTGGPLDWTPDRFLTLDKRLILCATHGALFRVRDGTCVGGPCAGRSLAAVRISIVDGEIRLNA